MYEIQIRTNFEAMSERELAEYKAAGGRTGVEATQWSAEAAGNTDNEFASVAEAEQAIAELKTLSPFAEWGAPWIEYRVREQ